MIGTKLSNMNFTVFAPNNDAFGKIDSETLGSLLKPENIGALSNILDRLFNTFVVDFISLRYESFYWPT